MQPDQFSAALLDPAQIVPAGVIGPDGQPSERRFAVYRNNVTHSLVEALRATFISVEALLGCDYFGHVARAFVRRFPPEGPVLAEYGARFAQFLSRVPLLAERRFIPDVAKLDLMWLTAYHAADAEALDAAALPADADRLKTYRLALHPAANILPSAHPVVALFNAARNGRADAGIDRNRAQTALVVRPQFEVRVVSLSPAAAALITQMHKGENFGNAQLAARNVDPSFDAADALKILARAGAFAARRADEGGEHA